MANTIVYVRGTAKWAKLRYPDKKYNFYGVDLYLSQDDAKRVSKYFKVKRNEEGVFISCRRPVSKVMKGELVDLGPPELLDKDNSELDKYEMVGNGSVVTCKIMAYETEKGKGTRLESLRVEELVSYRSTETDTGDDWDEAPF